MKKLVDDLSSVKSAFDKMSIGSDLSAKVGELSKIFGVLTSASDAMSKMKSGTTDMTTSLDSQLHNTMGAAASLLWNLISKPYGTGTMGPLSSIMWSIVAIGKIANGESIQFGGKTYGTGAKGSTTGYIQPVNELFKSVSSMAKSIVEITTANIPTDVSAKFGILSNSFNSLLTASSGDKSIFDIMAAIGQKSSSFSPAATAKTFTGIKSSLAAAQDMISKVNELNKTLSGEGADPIKIKSVLGAIAGNVGLGAGGKYEIRNRDVVIKVDLMVVMDAGKVENAIIQRANSVIRDKVNVLAAYVNKTKTSNKIETDDGDATIADTNYIKHTGPNTYTDSTYGK
jgi:hypothetical protein